jgi:Mor family transcriptional regulator
LNLLEQITLDSLPVEQREIASIVGIEAYTKLVEQYGGCNIYIFKADTLLKDLRDAQIKDEFDGYNHRELALKYDLSERTIRDIVSEISKGLKIKQIEGQINLFDLQ